MLKQYSFGYFDNAGTWRQTVQTWAEIPGTGCSVIVYVEEVAVDPADIPQRPERPA